MTLLLEAASVLASGAALVSTMPTSFINDPEHWRQRANDMRTLANSAKDARSKAAMLQIAAEYDGLAEMAEERSRSDPEPAE